MYIYIYIYVYIYYIHVCKYMYIYIRMQVLKVILKYIMCIHRAAHLNRSCMYCARLFECLLQREKEIVCMGVRVCVIENVRVCKCVYVSA